MHYRAITEIHFQKLIIWLLQFLAGNCCWVFLVCLSRSTTTTERYSQGYRPYREEFLGNNLVIGYRSTTEKIYQTIISNVPVTPTPSIFSKILPYKWGAYCSTNGRRTAGFPFLRSLEARKVRRYKWGAYCRTNWRCTAVLFRQVVGVGVSETLPKLIW